MAIDATATGMTVMAADPAIPSLVAVIVAGPGAMAVTRPVPLTVATEAAFVLQVTVRPVSAVPDASRGVAASCAVAPTVIGDVLPLTETDATAAGGGGGGVTVSLPGLLHAASRSRPASAVRAGWACILMGIDCVPEECRQ